MSSILNTSKRLMLSQALISSKLTTPSNLHSFRSYCSKMDSTISNIANFETIFSRKKPYDLKFENNSLPCHFLKDKKKVKKKLYVPRVEDKNSNMRMLNITRLDDLVANSMNILEPSLIDANGNEREDVMLTNEPVDVFLLPGLAFDKSGKRLGRGGGYYDEFLSKYQGLANVRGWRPSLLVALSYSQQIMDEGVIDVTPNDISIDALVTPSGIVLVNPALEKI